MGAGKISVFESSTTNGDDSRSDSSFILDIHSFDSRFTLQHKSLSRKGSKTSSNANEKDAIVTTTSSPRAGLGGNSSPGSPVVVVVDNHLQAHQHQISITNGSISSNAESKWGLRRNSFRRSSSSLGFDPRRIVFFLATLSSMGTMILIYFTLSMRKLNEGDGTLN